MQRSLQTAICEYYEEKLAEYGPTARGVDWNGTQSQYLRFKILAQIGCLNGKKVHDVGCGIGHLYDYLHDTQVKCDYVGSDISPAMVQAAKNRWPETSFYCADISQQRISQWMTADYVFASGIFHVKNDITFSVWEKYVKEMLSQLFDICRVGLAFNLMSTAVDYEADHLFYYPPAKISEYLMNQISRKFVIRHDYPLYEYSVYVYRGR